MRFISSIIKKSILLFVASILLLGSSCSAPADNYGSANLSAPAPTTSVERKSEIDFDKVIREIRESQDSEVNRDYRFAPNGYYENVDDDQIPRPYKAPVIPFGASAKCRDGTYSFSDNRRGTCSHHGGVITWY